MTTQTPPNALALIPQGLDESTAQAVQKFIPLLRELVVNGNKLNDQQIVGRAIFAAQQGLDPVTEVHTIVGKDGRTQAHTMAITGFRRKCQEQVGNGVDITLSFREMSKEELIKFNGASSQVLIGYECTLRDGQSYREWQKRLIEVGKALREAMGTAVAYDDIIRTVGPAPVYTGVGFFYTGELSPDYKDKNFNPIERAKKRAEVNARGKRFPRNAPIFTGDEVLNGTGPLIEAQFKEEPKFHTIPLSAQDIAELEGRVVVEPDAATKQTVEQNMADLGFTTTEKPLPVPDPIPQPMNDYPYIPDPEPEIQQGEAIVIDTSRVDPTETQRPYNLAALKAALDRWAGKYVDVKADAKHRGMLASCLNTSLDGSTEARHDFDLHVFGSTSLNDVPDPIVLAALKTWYGLAGWNDTPDPMAIQEAKAIYNEISIQLDKQPKLF